MSVNKDDTSKITEFYHWLNHYHSDDGSANELVLRFVAGVNLLAIEVYRCSMWLPTSHPELWGTNNMEQKIRLTNFSP